MRWSHMQPVGLARLRDAKRPLEMVVGHCLAATVAVDEREKARGREMDTEKEQGQGFGPRHQHLVHWNKLPSAGKP